MKNILLYGNGASGNHGCEAIVRGTSALLHDRDTRLIVLSDKPEEDIHYGLGNIADIQTAKSAVSRDMNFFAAYAKMKIAHDYAVMDALCYYPKIKQMAERTGLALSIGGDNYCYGGTGLYTELNKAYHEAGIKTVLWGCSVEPSILNKAAIRRDFLRYDGIAARESITYKAIKKVNANAVLAPDPAFYMKAVECPLDERFHTHEVIGINLSPMVISNEGKKGITLENYRRLTQYILEHTDYYIALIPHVVWEQNDDRAALSMLYESVRQKERVILVEDMTAPELKYCIAQCRMFIGARTHATIAAYSSEVPTLVVGYSVKARGIAKDLFGRYEHFVVPVQEISGPQELTEAFQWIENREGKIRGHLHEFLPEYLKKGESAIELLNSL